jgi:RNA polymerase sigma-B factor
VSTGESVSVSSGTDTDGGRSSARKTAALFEEYRRTGDRSTRNRLVEMHLHLADYHVGRFSRSSGLSSDDLRQTAFIAILHAVERFDPDKGVAFRTFASRTIEGELKRHLRDKSWSVRPPRRAQELHLQLRRLGDELSHRLGRAPTVAELAEEAGVDVESVLEAVEAGRARSATGLDAPGPSGTAESSLAQMLGSLDPAFGTVDERMVLEDVIAGLDERERLVLQLRYVDELSQPEIAEQIGVSQSYVSRILRSTLGQLRADLTTP